jgi:hypothetical protein
VNFTIQIPHRSRDESLVDVAGYTRVLGQDGPAIRELVIAARLDGAAASAGELIDHLDGLEPYERRQLLDKARASVGLPSTAEVEAAQPKPLQVRTVNGGSFPSCPAPECNAAPMRNGVFFAPDVRKWWCPNHEDQAQPGDLEPRGSGLAYSPSGSIVEVDPADDERDRAREESRAAQLEAQTADRAVEAAERRASKQASDRAHQTELPPHLRSAA